jgi:hypothetical protein
MEVISNSSNLLGNENDHREDLTLVSQLKDKECQILETGYKAQTMVYFFCSCDPDLKQPLCNSCYETCHAEHEKKQVISHELTAVCNCGLNYHRIKDEFKQDYTFNKSCLYLEWSEISGTRTCYIKSDSDQVICIFCANFCENFANLTKSITKEESVCSCTNETHHSAKNTLKRLSEIKNIPKFDFEYFTLTHIINLIFGSERSFTNIFEKLSEYLDYLMDNINKESYSLDANIGYSTAMISLETLSSLLENIDCFYYFEVENDAIVTNLKRKHVFALLDKK